MASRAADRENKKRRITEASGPVESLIEKDPSGNGPSLLFRSCLFSFGTGTAECGVIVSCDFSFYPPFWLPVQLAICYGILVSARSFVGLVGGVFGEHKLSCFFLFLLSCYSQKTPVDCMTLFPSYRSKVLMCAFSKRYPNGSGFPEASPSVLRSNPVVTSYF